jgi:hypothetical protein
MTEKRKGKAKLMGDFYMGEKARWDRHAELLAEANKHAQIRLLKQSLKENTGQWQTISVKRKLKIRLQAFFS